MDKQVMHFDTVNDYIAYKRGKAVIEQKVYEAPAEEAPKKKTTRKKVVKDA